MTKKKNNIAVHISVVDVDGVYADCTHRLKYAENKEYDKFYSEEEMMKDEPIATNMNSINAMLAAYDNVTGPDKEINFHLVVAMSGRPQYTVGTTKKWFKKYNAGFVDSVDIWAFRKEHDFRPSEVVKSENMVAVLRAIDRFMHSENVDSISASFTIIDDDPKNVKAIKQAIKDNLPRISDKAICTLIIGTDRL